MTEPKKVKRTDLKRESVARCGTAEAESLPPSARCALREGGTCQKLGTLHHRGE